MRPGVRSLLVQAGTCGALLLILLIAQALLIVHLVGRLHALGQDMAALRARYPAGVPDAGSLRCATDAIDQELGEHLYPQLHDLGVQLQAVAVQSQANAQQLHLLEAQLAADQTSEYQPAPTILPHPLDWAAYYLRDIDALNVRIQQGRSLDGALNARLNHLELAEAGMKRQISAAISRKDVLAAMAGDPQALADLRSRWHGLGTAMLCLEHLGLVLLLAALSLRSCFRLLILLGIPGELRLA